MPSICTCTKRRTVCFTLRQWGFVRGGWYNDLSIGRSAASDRGMWVSLDKCWQLQNSEVSPLEDLHSLSVVFFSLFQAWRATLSCRYSTTATHSSDYMALRQSSSIFQSCCHCKAICHCKRYLGQPYFIFDTPSPPFIPEEIWSENFII